MKEKKLRFKCPECLQYYATRDQALDCCGADDEGIEDDTNGDTD